MRYHSFAMLCVGVTVVASCGGDDDSGGFGGASGTAGSLSMGGASASAGATSSGGKSGNASGGAMNGAGQTGSAGSTAAGNGASAGSGGSTAGSGGSTAGSGGSTAGSGGSTAGNGGNAAGNAGTGTGGGSSGMNFFVTSKGGDKGGNFGGLDGADAFCKSLAMAVSAELGQKQWRAYLSTTTENARDRIGMGPWRNQAGRVIANNLTQLHDQLGASATLNTTWPVGNGAFPLILDERGNQVPSAVHDVLTGSNADGTVMAGLTCNDWMSASSTDMAQIGHVNRMGLVGQPPSWNSVHTVGCAPSAMNRAGGTVTSGGGRGSLYCFALP